MTRAVISGASGFVGRHLAAHLKDLGWQVEALAVEPSATAVAVPGLETVHGWEQLPAWDDVDVVFHLGGLAHANVAAPVKRLYEVNVEQTLALYRHARERGVRQFVWLSSIKALGDVSVEPFTVNSPTQPADPYGQSKALAERALMAEDAGEIILSIVRPPLIYGPGVKANFLRLLSWAERGWPLPLARATSPRSWLAVDNLADFLVQLTTVDAAREAQIWHVRDVEEASVADLMRQLGAALGQRIRLWPVNARVALALSRLVGQGRVAERLFCPLQLDVSATERLLGWHAPIAQREALAKVAAWYQAQ